MARVVTSTVLSCSQLGAATGLDPYRSPIALWAEITGLADPREPNEAMLWGTLLEPVVREQVEARGYEIMPGPDVMLADDLPFLVGHPDGFVKLEDERGILEVKTAGAWVRGWEDEGVPAQYLAQVHGYMALADTRRALVACLVGGQRLELRTVERDDRFLELLLATVEEFIGYVTRNEPPPPDGTAATDEILKRLYPHGHAGATVELTVADMQTVGQLRALKAQRKEVERQEEELTQVLQMRMQDAELGTHDGVPVVRWTTVERKAYEVKAGTYRRFTVSE